MEQSNNNHGSYNFPQFPYAIDFTQHNHFVHEMGFNDWNHVSGAVPVINSEAAIFNPNDDYHHHHHIGTGMGETSQPFFSPTPEDIYNIHSSTAISHHHFNGVENIHEPILNSFHSGGIEHGKGDANEVCVDEEEDEFDEDDYDGTAENSSATPGPPTKSKVDRARTLISERRRRGRMKGKLYALRSLVPNITKMDKASIVGDAVLYIQDMQTQAQTLRGEIADLESSFRGTSLRTGLGDDDAAIASSYNHTALVTAHKIITQMAVLQLTSNEYHVKISSNKGRGIARLLYKAVESLNDFVILNSNLTTAADRLNLTFTLNVEDWQNVDSSRLKLWISAALLNQGFQFQTI